MIIRILADGQYRLDTSQFQEAAEIAELDEDLVQELDAGDASGFHITLGQLIQHVHESGHIVPVEELVPSDVIVPAEDMTLAETKELLTVGR